MFSFYCFVCRQERTSKDFLSFNSLCALWCEGVWWQNMRWAHGWVQSRWFEANCIERKLWRFVVRWILFHFSFIHFFLQSNSTPHSGDEDDKHSEADYQRSPPQKYLDEAPPHDVPEAFAQQQRELLERLKEQFTSFPFNNHAANLAGIDLSEQAQQRLQTQTEAHKDFPFSFPTPPPSKGEDDVKTSSASAKKSSQNSSSWSYEDQFKQVRQVS